MVFLRTICPVFLFLIGIVPGLFAADFELLPVQTPFFSASSLDFRSYLFTGSENDRLVNHGNLGLDYPLVGYGPRDLTVGIAAAVHLVMYPEHLKWPVDNLYATLATYIGYVPSSWLTLRLFPVYHVSGHLADGTTDTSGPNSLKDPEAVSAEMVKLESDITPLHGLSLSIGYGRYYHVCSQTTLTDHADAGVQLQPWQTGVVRPYLMVMGEAVHMSQWYPGCDMELGTQFANSRNHAIGVCLRYFNILDPGYYFMSREKGIGVQVNFLL